MLTLLMLGRGVSDKMLTLLTLGSEGVGKSVLREEMIKMIIKLIEFFLNSGLTPS